MDDNNDNPMMQGLDLVLRFLVAISFGVMVLPFVPFLLFAWGCSKRPVLTVTIACLLLASIHYFRTGGLL